MSIPDGPFADAQGKHAFKKLREWRKLHETSWEPPATLARPYSEKEIKVMQDELDNRGGSKVDTVYDIIRKKKKQMRINIVMDQKANSVADLAAVLIEQEQLGAKTAEQKEEEAKTFLAAERSLMLRLAEEVEKGGLDSIKSRIEELEAMKAKADRLGEAEQSKRQITKQMHGLHVKEKKMQFASKAVASAKQKLAQAAEERVSRLERRLKILQARNADSISEAELADGFIAAELGRIPAEKERLLAILDAEAVLPEPSVEPSVETAAESQDSSTKAEAASSTDSTLPAEPQTNAELLKKFRSSTRRHKILLQTDPDAAAKYQSQHDQLQAAASVGIDAAEKLRNLNRRIHFIEEAQRDIPQISDDSIAKHTTTLRSLRLRLSSSRDKPQPVREELQSAINACINRLAHAKNLRETYDKVQAVRSEITKVEAELAELTQQADKPEVAAPAPEPVQLEPGSEAYQTALGDLLPSSFPIPSEDNPNLPKRGRLRGLIRHRKRPIFASEGIKIKWSNLLDAEYAQTWPDNVSHHPMGLARHTAPRADAEPIMDVASMRKLNIESKRSLRAPEDAEARALGTALEGVKLDVLRRVREAVAAKEEEDEASRAATRAARQSAREAAQADSVRAAPLSRTSREGRYEESSMSALLNAIR
jgi:hypothetical protein